MSSFLVTGGAGSFGQAFVRDVLADAGTSRVVVYSRCEERHRVMANEIPDPRLRFFVGDVRDRDRLRLAMKGIDTVVHAAALKQVPACEYNPDEAVKTNIDGSRNVVWAALDNEVRRALLISSDKACSPHNLYGATKAVAEKIVVHANAYSGANGTRFCAVRYGNVFGSRGSVLHVWERQAKEGKPIAITHPEMTRFWFTLPKAVAFVRDVLMRTKGGEVWIPKLPSFRVADLREALYPAGPWEEIGIRHGEKLHESMIAKDESLQAWDTGDHYAICPPVGEPLGDRTPDGAVGVQAGFRYRSDMNTEWLEVGELRRLFTAHNSARVAA